nr:MAG TPA: hypothetical protein [Caudoviricetes sp.]
MKSVLYAIGKGNGLFCAVSLVFTHWLRTTYVYPKPIIYSFGNMIANITAV